MYPLMEVKETVTDSDNKTEETKEVYCLRPMNCPHHHKVFAARMRSYRELPIRLAEYVLVLSNVEIKFTSSSKEKKSVEQQELNPN